MPLVKGFLQSKLIRKIPTYKFVVGIVVGLLMAFVLYALQYMTREGLRWTSISETNLWFFNEAEMSFYNLIFAFIAVIVGQSFFLEYLFNTPKGNFRIRSGRLQTIVNDQRLFNWYFLTWFSKMATMYGFLFGTAGLGGFYLMSFYPDYRFLFVLLIIVLFIQPWNGLLLTFKKRAFKWMGVSVVIVSILSFGLSKIDIVDYKLLNDKIINNRLDVKYNLRIPTIHSYDGGDEERHFGYRFMHLPNISIAMPKDGNAANPLLFIGQTKINKSKFPIEVLEMKAKQSYELQNFMPTFLRIDKMVPMSFVREIKRDLYYLGLPNINYLVIPSDAKYNTRYYEGRRRTFLTQYILDVYSNDYTNYRENINIRTNKIDIFISKNGYRVGGTVIPPKELSHVLNEKLIENLDYVIVLNFEDDINFDIYFGLISSINEVIFSLRDEYALKEYEIDFKSILFDYDYKYDMKSERMEIMDKYPMRYIEVWDNSGIELPSATYPYPPLPGFQSSDE
ncbi:MAG: hypothetical protein AB8B59_14255 [Maribacter sp.]